MTTQVHAFDKGDASRLANEPDVEVFANAFLSGLGFTLKHRKTGNKDLDKHWPSKTVKAKSPGAPDILIYQDSVQKLPFCVWENKGPAEGVSSALDDAKFYITGLHVAKPGTPGLPRLAAGFNGHSLRLAYFNHGGKWQPVRSEGLELVDCFPEPTYAQIGFSSNGNFLAARGHATAQDLRNVLPTLKNIYRGIPSLKTGRLPIDFTISVLTLRMLCEMLPVWGAWAEQPSLAPDAEDVDHAIRERFLTLLGRLMGDRTLRAKYGDIFEFSEKGSGANAELAFSFSACVGSIEAGRGFFERIYYAIDALPPLHGAEFDVFGEVYQAIGDDSTKKALGEFFTGRHIIAAVIPLLFRRANITNFGAIQNKTIADIACGTGGFLTETLRYIRRAYRPAEAELTDFARRAFFGYDLSQSNASRARVNMYFAGDGFSTIVGGVDSLTDSDMKSRPRRGFDFMLANPPYGQRLEEAFLSRILSLLAVDGWGMVILPTGVLENPRSSGARMELLRSARVLDVIALPAHAFAPYTKQRTAIIVFQKRANRIAADDWPALIDHIGAETASMFIVDNDGYANSDKRYETAVQSAVGEWLHDDLKGWVHKRTGKFIESRLLSALVNKSAPGKVVDEFGRVLGKKYGEFSIKQLHAQLKKTSPEHARGVSMLPDLFLRPTNSSFALDEFREKANLVQGILQGDRFPQESPLPLIDLIRYILRTSISLSPTGSVKNKIKDLFDISKGDTGLTEAVIYHQQDSDDGLWVYGGVNHFRASRLSATQRPRTGRQFLCTLRLR